MFFFETVPNNLFKNNLIEKPSKTYHQVEDFVNAVGLLTSPPHSLTEAVSRNLARKLMGRQFQGLNMREGAEYEKAEYKLDESQKKLVLQICDQLVQLSIDTDQARYIYIHTNKTKCPEKIRQTVKMFGVFFCILCP